MGESASIAEQDSSVFLMSYKIVAFDSEETTGLKQFDDCVMGESGHKTAK